MVKQNKGKKNTMHCVQGHEGINNRNVCFGHAFGVCILLWVESSRAIKASCYGSCSDAVIIDVALITTTHVTNPLIHECIIPH